jgi:hypothetical protein
MKFLVDRMLGKLAKGLRILGYDAVYYRGEDLYPLLKIAREENRMILTRNSRLVPRIPEDRIFHVTVDQPSLQLKELFQKGIISRDEETPFSRCLLCNVRLDGNPREDAQGKVPDFIFYQKTEFYRCPRCQRIYWQGSHPENMERRIKELLRTSSS